MKIKFIDKDKLLEMKANAYVITENYLNTGELELNKIFNNQKVFFDTNFEINEFKLDISNCKPELTDFENIKRIYTNLRFLTVSQASDERLWAALCCNQFFYYMKYRWPIKSKKEGKNNNDFLNNYCFNYSKQRSLYRNGMARLWWIGYMTYDADREDPYELTKFICKDQDHIEVLLGHNYTNNKMILNETLSALINSREKGKKTDRHVVREIAKYLNLLGGIYILDMFSPKEIYDKVYEKIDKLQGEKNE